MSALELVPAGNEHRVVLANLLELYIHDFSEILGMEIGPDGRFGYAPLPLYGTEPGRHAYLARSGGNWAGFALVQQVRSEGGVLEHWDMAEFFVLRAHRRRGLGVQMAEALFAAHPGKWQIRVMRVNAPAREFWRHVAACCLVRDRSEREEDRDGRTWHILTFTT